MKNKDVKLYLTRLKDSERRRLAVKKDIGEVPVQNDEEKKLQTTDIPTNTNIKNESEKTSAKVTRKQWRSLILALCMISVNIISCLRENDIPDNSAASNYVSQYSNYVSQYANSDKENLLSGGALRDDIIFGENYSKEEIEKVVFLDSLESMPQDSWNASPLSEGNVWAWIEDKDLYIAADGDIYASSCRYLFQGYHNLKEIYFNGCFKTENISDMSYMFAECRSLSSVDLGSLDISQVNNTYGMFSGCNSLTSVYGINNNSSFTVEDGDTVCIDYSLMVDGVKHGFSTYGEELLIGSDTYMDGFEEQLIGAQLGDTVHVAVTFPDNYGDERLNGKEAVYVTAVRGIVKNNS